MYLPDLTFLHFGNLTAYNALDDLLSERLGRFGGWHGERASAGFGWFSGFERKPSGVRWAPTTLYGRHDGDDKGGRYRGARPKSVVSFSRETSSCVVRGPREACCVAKGNSLGKNLDRGTLSEVEMGIFSALWKIIGRHTGVETNLVGPHLIRNPTATIGYLEIQQNP